VKLGGIIACAAFTVNYFNPLRIRTDEDRSCRLERSCASQVLWGHAVSNARIDAECTTERTVERWSCATIIVDWKCWMACRHRIWCVGHIARPNPSLGEWMSAEWAFIV